MNTMDTTKLYCIEFSNHILIGITEDIKKVTDGLQAEETGSVKTYPVTREDWLFIQEKVSTHKLSEGCYKPTVRGYIKSLDRYFNYGTDPFEYQLPRQFKVEADYKLDMLRARKYYSQNLFITSDVVRKQLRLIDEKFSRYLIDGNLTKEFYFNKTFLEMFQPSVVDPDTPRMFYSEINTAATRLHRKMISSGYKFSSSVDGYGNWTKKSFNQFKLYDY